MSVVCRLDCTPSLSGSPGVPLVSVDLPHSINLYLDRAQLISSNACVQPVAAVLGCAALCMRQTLMSRVLHALPCMRLWMGVVENVWSKMDFVCWLQVG